MQDNLLVLIGLPLSLFIIMAGMGLSLTINDFRRVFEYPRGVAIGTGVQLLIIPALGFAIGYAAGGGMFAVGLVLLAALPGGTTSNILTFLAKANLALSITLTVIASLVTIITIPLYVNIASSIFVGDAESLSLPVLKTLITMLVIVVIPVGLGMLLNAKYPVFAKRMESPISIFSMLVLIIIIIGIVASEWRNLAEWLAAAWLPVLAMNISALLVAMLIARMCGLTVADALTVSIESGIKNTTLGLTIALSLLHSTELALPAAVYGLFMYASVVALIFYGRKKARQANQVV